MLAVLKTGGKQYVVKEGMVLQAEKIEAEVGENVSFNDVLFIDNGTSRIFNPSDVTITAKVLEQRRAEKIIVFKKRRRKNYRRKNGHRQYLTVLKIISIPAA